MAVTLHPLPPSVQAVQPPELFTFPFCYEPHPLCIAAADEVRRYLGQHPEWHDELHRGKMFGVLVAKAPPKPPEPSPSPAGPSPSPSLVGRGVYSLPVVSSPLPTREGQGEGLGLSFLAAFSGTLDGRTRHPYFVPPVFDLMAPGCYFQEEEAAIGSLNKEIETLRKALRPSPLHERMQEELSAYRQRMQQHKAERDALRRQLSADELAEREPALVRESQHEKAEYRRLKRRWEERIAAEEAPLRERQQQRERLQRERHERSLALQQWLFRQFVFLNALGEEKALPELFHPATPPSGAGECCAPRLLQAAYRVGLRPLCMAEFWVGDSPKDEVRHDGHFYPACRSKCRPILRHMLRGLDVEPNPLLLAPCSQPLAPYIIYNNRELAVVSKPAGLLSVPGKDDQPNVQDFMRQRFPQATGPLIVHRLDMDTSGLMLVALTEEKYHELQDLFLHRRIHKVYHALLAHEMPVGEEGDICLPLRPDYDDRPRQMVDPKHGKPAQTHYRVIENRDGHAFVELRPITGRTHQLRVHCAHPLGLGNPIVGDRLYGKPAERLMLHAYSITIDGHTITDNYEL